MAPLHQKLRDRAACAVDNVHAEFVQIIPQLPENQYTGSKPDLDREVFDITAVLKTELSKPGEIEFGRDKVFSGVALASYSLHVARSELSDQMTIKKGDVVVALERDGQPNFTADHVDTRSAGRINVTLLAKG